MPKPAYILALDSGTTSVRSILFDSSGNPVAQSQKTIQQFYPKPGWVEHDADEIWSKQYASLLQVLRKAKVGANEVKAIGITNQRETVVAWDRSSGKPLHRAIVWQDSRGEERCKVLEETGEAKWLNESSGLPLESYFSATKMEWLMRNCAAVKKAHAEGNLCLGTIDSWLLFKLSKGESFATDGSNASRTMLFNINSLSWDEKALALFGIPKESLPEVKTSDALFGHVEIDSNQIPIRAVLGDQQAALYGQGAWKTGQLKNTYGTGCFMLMNTGGKKLKSNAGLITTLAWQLENEEACYALEGSVFHAGSAIGWLKDQLKLLQSASQSEDLCEQADPESGVIMVPAFTGLGAPYWNAHAEASFFGISLATTRKEMVKAVLESLAHQSADLILAMEKDLGRKIPELCVDGGVANNAFLLQFQADILGIPVSKSAFVESTAWGVAHLAGIATKVYRKELKRNNPQSFVPRQNEAWRKEKSKRWKRAIESTLTFSKP